MANIDLPYCVIHAGTSEILVVPADFPESELFITRVFKHWLTVTNERDPENAVDVDNEAQDWELEFFYRDPRSPEDTAWFRFAPYRGNSATFITNPES